MSDNRRRFLKHLGIGAGMLALDLPAFAATNDEMRRSSIEEKSGSSFNMTGYGAPGMDKVRIGFIGLGSRGSGAIRRYVYIENVEIKALCDLVPGQLDKNQKTITNAGLPKADTYTGKDGWKKLCDRKDLDLIYICTDWATHTPMSVYAMKSGKHVAVEVPAAVTLNQCWDLVNTSEATKKHCMMLENCCYDFFEITTLNLAQQGLFGELVHAEGAYIHELMGSNFSKTGYHDMWRLNENANRNGNLYPTHGLGPIAQCLNVNRGDKMGTLVSMSTHDFMMHDEAVKLASKDAFYQPYTKKSFRGNMNTTVVKTHKGKTMMIQHDVTTPRPYSRIHLLSGTKGMAQKYPEPERISFGHQWLPEAELKKVMKEYTPPIISRIGEMAKKVGGHGGMDFMMDWRLIDCLRNGMAPEQDVYDAALWSAVGIMSERSVALNSKPVEIPDFSRGKWKLNKPVNLSLEGSANTSLRPIR